MSNRPIYEATVKIDPLPKVRMTQRSKWTPASNRYLQYQEALSWEFKSKLCLSDFPMGHDISFPVIISVVIFLNHNRKSDFSNLLKAIEDALQHAGIVKNDHLIEGCVESYLYRQSPEGGLIVKLFKRNIDDNKYNPVYFTRGTR